MQCYLLHINTNQVLLKLTKAILENCSNRHRVSMGYVPDTQLAVLHGLSPKIGSIKWILEVFQIYKWEIEADILNNHSQGMVEREFKFVWVPCLVLQALSWQTPNGNSSWQLTKTQGLLNNFPAKSMKLFRVLQLRSIKQNRKSDGW